MSPSLAMALAVGRRPGRYRYETTGDARRLAGAAAAIAEGDVWSVVELHPDGEWAWLTITTETDLELVGLTAAIAPALAERDIPTNVLAAHRHDHLLVPHERAGEAMAVISSLHETERSDTEGLPYRELGQAAAVIALLTAPGFGLVLELLGRPRGATDGDVIAAMPDHAKARLGDLAALRDAGVITSSQGAHRLTDERPLPLVARLRELAAGPLDVPTAVAGYVDNGRLARYPRNDEHLAELLAAVAVHVGPGSVLSERAITARLAAIAVEPVELRRRLVDAGFVERTSTGSRYFIRPTRPAASSG